MTQSPLHDKHNVQSFWDASKHQPHWMLCIVLIILVSIYWGVWATNRYVSHASIVISMPQISTGQSNFSSEDSSITKELAAGLLLSDYVASADMLQYLLKNTDFRQHYSENGDIFSRLWNADHPLEKMLKYYQGVISVEPDQYSGILHVDVQAYTPEEAHKLATLILQQGQTHMNEMAQKVAQGQVTFLQQQADLLEKQYQAAQDASLKFENEHGLAAPTNTLANYGSIISQLQGQLASLRAQRSALSSYQSPKSPQMVSVSSQISALERQIDSEQQRLASKSGNTLNAVSARFQALQLRAQFALQAYSGVLTALENARVAAASQTVQVSYIQNPTLPQYSEEPTRLYNIVVFAIIAIFVTLIINMLILIVKDHKD